MENIDTQENLLNKETITTKRKSIISKPKKNDKYRIIANSKLQHNISNQEYLVNKICTSKYNIVNAIPKILCEQFSKIGNIYFLFLAVLQMIPSISQSGGVPFMLVPISFVVLVNGIKDFFEDYKRKQSDNRENKTKCILIDPKSYDNTIVNWEDLRPGDFVKISKDEYFPSDMVLLYSSNKNGVAYVETKNLDGETNLKYKESLKNTYNLMKHCKDVKEIEHIIKKILGIIDCELPNAHMYEFNGIYYNDNKDASNNQDISLNIEKNRNSLEKTLEIENSPELSKPFITNYEKRSQIEANIEKHNSKYNNTSTLDYNNLLLRGSCLRNTEFIYGIIIYCGHNSKIMLNSLNARSKQSKVFKIMNSQLKLIIILQMILCLTFSVMYSIDPDPYEGILYTSNNNLGSLILNFVFSFLAWLLTISNIVPISLLVTIEMIKFCQAIFISWDFKLYDKENRRNAIVQSSALNEELGQVNHIFTDKTGTLTKNVMQFKYMVIGEFLYGSDNHIDITQLKEGKVTNVDFNDSLLYEHWNDSSHPNSDNIKNFIFCLAICHSIVVEKKDEEITYHASSPDELALVNAAKFFGVEFTERTDDNYIIIKFKDINYKFKLLHIFEFNSNRKRMSVVVRDQNGVIRLITKGADSVISDKLDEMKRGQVEKKVGYYLEEFGKKGLRTLMVAKREISEREYSIFLKKYIDALTSIVTNKEKLELTYDSLEKDLELIGATAIEDCLQDYLKPTLEFFKGIGIKLWMLTGDHPFTAVSIAHSCGIIEPNYQVIIISSPNFEEINKKLLEVIDLESNIKACLVITGNVLTIIQNPRSTGLKSLFLLSIKRAECVISSRVSPKQKAELILMVKEKEPSITTLAIGDGANDVNMITTADVGIGIMGNEGHQAARASDYVIGQFSFLKRLMFVHGREAYRKNSFAVGYILWKNFLYVTPCIFLGFSSYFSGQTLFDPILDTLYNILFTAYPIGWFATYDKSLNYDNLETDGNLYKIGMKNKYFNIYVFWRWYLYALTAGFIIYWINSSIFNIEIGNESSRMLDIWTIGSSMYTCIVFVVNLKLFLATNTHDIFSLFLISFSILTFIFTLWFTSRLDFLQSTGQWKELVNNWKFVVSIVLIIISCMLCEYAWRSIKVIIEQYVFKRIQPTSPLKHESSIIKKFEEDSVTYRKGYSVHFNKNSKIFEQKEMDQEEVEIPSKNDDINIDQNIVDNQRRYTGFAFSEDVANVNILNESIKENFYDLKFQKLNEEN